MKRYSKHACKSTILARETVRDETDSFAGNSESGKIGKSAGDCQPGCRDPHLENYFPYIERLHHRTGRGPVGGHLLNAVSKAYALYCGSCDGFFRRSCWSAITASVQWLSQLPENPSKLND